MFWLGTINKCIMLSNAEQSEIKRFLAKLKLSKLNNKSDLYLLVKAMDSMLDRIEKLEYKLKKVNERSNEVR